jgi:hypothetical protein
MAKKWISLLQYSITPVLQYSTISRVKGFRIPCTVLRVIGHKKFKVTP